ncbi:MAG: serine hydrolase domain-containing protein [Phycisphaerae bacterium]
MSKSRMCLKTACLLTICAMIAFAGETTSRESGAKPIPKEFSGLRDRWESAMKDLLTPGMAVVVVKNDEVIYLDTFGERDPQKNLPVTPDTAFYIASATKPFNAMAILTLVDDGKIDLDAPVKQYLPRFDLPDREFAAKVTVRDLLCHRPGINAGPAVFLDAYTGEITEDRYYHFLASDAKIAGKTDYTNIHFTLIGRIIEAVSGKPWQEYLIDRILKPAGMNHTTPYATEMYARDDVAIPQQHNSDATFRPADTRKSDETMHAAGGLGTTAHDLGQWLRLNINRGVVDGKRIVSEKMMDEMLKMQSTSEPDGEIRVRKGFGLGWGRGTFRDHEYAFHGGGYIGAAAHTSFLVEDNVGVCVVANAGGPASAMVDAIVSIDVYDRLLGIEADDLLPGYKTMLERRRPEYLASQNPTQTPLTDANLSQPQDAYVGTYTNEHWGTIRIARGAGTITGNWGKLSAHFTPTTSTDAFTLTAGGDDFAGKFVLEGNRVVGLHFDEDNLRFEKR